MDSIETRQRIRYLIEHGGLWEQSVDQNERTHRWVLGMLAVIIVLQLILIALLR